MPNNFGGPQDHPAYDSRRKLNPKTEYMVGNTLYTYRTKDRMIEILEIDGHTMVRHITDSILPLDVRNHFNSLTMKFSSWDELLTYCQNNKKLYYQAALDRYPIEVTVTKQFKNKKLRIKVTGNYSDVVFTADEKHLERFSYKS